MAEYQRHPLARPHDVGQDFWAAGYAGPSLWDRQKYIDPRTGQVWESLEEALRFLAGPTDYQQWDELGGLPDDPNVEAVMPDIRSGIPPGPPFEATFRASQVVPSILPERRITPPDVVTGLLEAPVTGQSTFDLEQAQREAALQRAIRREEIDPPYDREAELRDAIRREEIKPPPVQVANIPVNPPIRLENVVNIPPQHTPKPTNLKPFMSPLLSEPYTQTGIGTSTTLPGGKIVNGNLILDEAGWDEWLEQEERRAVDRALDFDNLDEQVQKGLLDADAAVIEAGTGQPSTDPDAFVDIMSDLIELGSGDYRPFEEISLLGRAEHFAGDAPDYMRDELLRGLTPNLTAYSDIKEKFRETAPRQGHRGDPSIPSDATVTIMVDGAGNPVKEGGVRKEVPVMYKGRHYGEEYHMENGSFTHLDATKAAGVYNALMDEWVEAQDSGHRGLIRYAQSQLAITPSDIPKESPEYAELAGVWVKRHERGHNGFEALQENEAYWSDVVFKGKKLIDIMAPKGPNGERKWDQVMEHVAVYSSGRHPFEHNYAKKRFNDTAPITANGLSTQNSQDIFSAIPIQDRLQYSRDLASALNVAARQVLDKLGTKQTPGFTSSTYVGSDPYGAGSVDIVGSTTQSTKPPPNARELKGQEAADARKRKLAEDKRKSRLSSKIGAPRTTFEKTLVDVGTFPNDTAEGRKSWYGVGQNKKNVGQGTAYLAPDAAADFKRMNKAFKDKFGRDIKIESAYRTNLHNEALKKKGAVQTSKHKEGTALDITSKKERDWIIKNGADKYGWIWHDYKNKKGKRGTSNHFYHTGKRKTTSR